MTQARQGGAAAEPDGAGRPVGTERGAVVVTLLMLAVIGWYFHDAASRSVRVENLIMIVPMSIAAAAVGAILLAGAALRLRRARGAAAAPCVEPVGRRATAVAGLLCAYLACMEPLGLDAATALFLSACFAVLGVRGWVGLAIAPIAVAVAVVWGMKAAFYIHIPTLLDGHF